METIFNNEEVRELTRTKHIQRNIEVYEIYEKNVVSTYAAIRTNTTMYELIERQFTILKKSLPKKVLSLYLRKWEIEGTEEIKKKDKEKLTLELGKINVKIKAFKKETAGGKLVQEMEDLRRSMIGIEETIKDADKNIPLYELRMRASKNIETFLDGTLKLPEEVKTPVDFATWVLCEFDKLMEK